MRRFNLRRGLLSSAAGAVVVTVLAAIPSVASASSFGCTAAGSGLPWYGLNSAYTCIDVGGSGDTVWSVQGEWFGIGTLCNYRFRIRFRDIRGRLLRDLLFAHPRWLPRRGWELDRELRRPTSRWRLRRRTQEDRSGVRAGAPERLGRGRRAVRVDSTPDDPSLS